MVNPYAVLGLEPTASDDEVKKAFRRLASENHPDRNPGDAAKEARFKDVNAAYQILGNPDKRVVYDHEMRKAKDASEAFKDMFGGMKGSKVSQVVDDLFGGQGGAWGDILRRAQDEAAARKQDRSRVRQPPPETQTRGDDITTELRLTLAEAARGCRKKVRARSPRPAAPCLSCSGTGAEPGTRRLTCSSCAGNGKTIKVNGDIPRPVVCPTCRGRGSIALTPCKGCGGQGKMVHEAEITVTVPSGVQTGQQLRLAGLGTPGFPPGDLYLNIEVENNERFVRQGNNIHTQIRIPLVTAIRGGAATFESLDGTEQTVEVPAGVQPGSTLVVKGAGVRGSVSSGDMYVTVHVGVPKNLSERAKKLLEELADEIGEPR